MGTLSGADTMSVAVIGDRHAKFAPQDAIEPALQHSGKALGIDVDVTWFDTPSLLDAPEKLLSSFDSIWCAPGSPFRSLEGALNGIRFARSSGVPFLGTCAGFQHGVLEVARNLAGATNAQHAEYGPVEESDLFIDELLCSLVGMTMPVSLVDSSIRDLYRTDRVEEQYYCRFGLNEKFLPTLSEHGLVVAGKDETDNGTRILRLDQHCFYYLTLFVPQTRSTPENPHPLVSGFVKAASAFRSANDQGFVESVSS